MSRENPISDKEYQKLKKQRERIALQQQQQLQRIALQQQQQQERIALKEQALAKEKKQQDNDKDKDVLQKLKEIGANQNKIMETINKKETGKYNKKDKDIDKDIDKNSNKNSNKKEPIPNTLIIFIKTRIPNYYKINYSPSMTVPNSRSQSVYFDPLIEYYYLPLMNLMSNAPPDAKFTQFFEANQFEGMKNRILSNFVYMQKERSSLKEATDQGLIDNNIQLTLDVLFRKNNLFYLGEKPYTIVGTRWEKGSWDLDIKPVNKLMSYFSKNAIEEAKKELAKIAEPLRQGNLSAANIVLENPEVSEIKTELGKNTLLESIKEKAKYSEELYNILGEQVPEFAGTEIYLILHNIPINYSNTINLPIDPVTLSLLVSYEDIYKFLEKTKETSTTFISDCADFQNQKIKLRQLNNTYSNQLVELFKLKKSYDTQSNKLISIKIKNIRTAEYDDDGLYKEYLINKVQMNNELGGELVPNLFAKNNNLRTIIIAELEKYDTIKEKLINQMLLCFQTLSDYFETQTLFFKTTIKFLEHIRDNYNEITGSNIILNDQSLIIKCINSDISCYKLLSDPNNLTNQISQSYFKNINQINEKRKIFEERKTEILTPMNQVEKFEKYEQSPTALSVELQQYTLYINILSLTKCLNESYIWQTYLKTTDDLVENFSLLFGEKVTDYEKLLNDINIVKKDTMVSRVETKINELINANKFKDVNRMKKEITISESGKTTELFKEMIELIDNSVEDIENAFTSSENSKKWRFVNEKGNTLFKFNKYEKKYLDLFISEMVQKTELYDSIILFTHLMQIRCLREEYLYISEENVVQMDLIFLSNEYRYNNILDIHLNRSVLNKVKTIPDSIFWNTQNLKEELPNKIEQYQKFKSLQENKMILIKERKKDATEKCESIGELLSPVMSERGIQEQCGKLLRNYKTYKNVFVIPFSLNLSLNGFLNDINSPIDFSNTIQFQIKINEWTEKYMSQMSEDTFAVYKNVLEVKPNPDTLEKHVSLFSLYDTIVTALNGQLDYLNVDTVNMYTEPNLQGKNRFTHRMLHKLVKDNFEDDSNEVMNDIETQVIEKKTIGEIISKISEVLKIQFYVFEIINDDLRIDCDESPKLKYSSEGVDHIFLFKQLEQTGVIYKSIRLLNRDDFIYRDFDSDINVDIDMYKEDPNSRFPKYLNLFYEYSCKYLEENYDNIIDDNIQKFGNKTDYAFIEEKEDYEDEKSEIFSEPEICKVDIDSFTIFNEQKLLEQRNKITELTNIDINQLSFTSLNGSNTIALKIVNDCKELIEKIEQRILCSDKIDSIKIDRLKQIKIGLEANLKTVREIKARIEELEVKTDRLNKFVLSFNDIKQNINSNKLTGNAFQSNSLRNFKSEYEYLKEIISEECKSNLIIPQIKHVLEANDFVNIVSEYFRFVDDFKAKMVVKQRPPSFEEWVNTNTKQELLKLSITDKLVDKPIECVSDEGDEEKEEQIDLDGIDENELMTFPVLPDINMEEPKEQEGQNGGVGEINKKILDYDNVAPRYQNYGYGYQQPNYYNQSLNQNIYNTIRPSLYDQSTYNQGLYNNGLYNQGLYNQGFNQRFNLFPYGRQLPIDYTHNMLNNINKEQKSKLSYYIEIELELFPGTNISMIQRYSVKCQTTFERIREAWANIFGYEYRPGVLEEAYSYQASKPVAEKKQETEKKEETEKKQEIQTKGGAKSLKILKRNKNRNKTLKSKK